MRREEAIRILEAHRQEMRERFGVKSLRIFGSVARDEASEHSDVDVLVDFNGRRLKFHEECRMLDELEIIFGRKVDLVQAESLASSHMNPHRRASIATTAKVVYDASS